MLCVRWRSGRRFRRGFGLRSLNWSNRLSLRSRFNWSNRFSLRSRFNWSNRFSLRRCFNWSCCFGLRRRLCHGFHR